MFKKLGNKKAKLKKLYFHVAAYQWEFCQEIEPLQL